MTADTHSVEGMGRGAALEELPTAGLQVEETLEVEDIELTARLPGRAAGSGWETSQPRGESHGLLPDDYFDLDLEAADAGADAPLSPREHRLEREILELAAELAVLRREVEQARAERARMAEALAERGKQVARLLGELNRRPARRRTDRDFRSAPRLLGTEEPLTPAADPERAAPRRFLLSMEAGSAEAHELTGKRAYVGRAPEAGIRITDVTVSRVHAVLRLDGEQVVVEDAASTNGVFVNGARVRAAALSDFDTVTFGNVSYLFRLGPAAEGGALRGQ